MVSFIYFRHFLQIKSSRIKSWTLLSFFCTFWIISTITSTYAVNKFFTTAPSISNSFAFFIFSTRTCFMNFSFGKWFFRFAQFPEFFCIFFLTVNFKGGILFFQPFYKIVVKKIKLSKKRNISVKKKKIVIWSAPCFMKIQIFFNLPGSRN